MFLFGNFGFHFFCWIFVHFFMDFSIADSCEPIRQQSESSVCNSTVSRHGNLRPFRRDKDDTPVSCDMRFFVDLALEQTTEYDLEFVKDFFFESFSSCFDANVGHTVYFTSFMNYTPDISCCNSMDCGFEMYYELELDTWVKPYNSTELIINDEAMNLNLLQRLKLFDSQRCKYNNAIWITNRIYKMDERLSENIQEVLDYACTTLNIIVVHPNVTLEMLQHFYSNFSAKVFAVNDYRCLLNLYGCIKPCSTFPDEQCLLRNLTSCPNNFPVQIFNTTTVGTTADYTPTDNTIPSYSYRMIYVFALSTNITSQTFDRIKYYIVRPLEDCLSDGVPIAVEFVASNLNSTWQLTHEGMLNVMQNIALVNAAHPIDTKETHTLNMILTALDMMGPVPLDGDSKQPKITLLTDFFSKKFADTFALELSQRLSAIDFQLFAYNNETGELYRSNTSIRNQDIHVMSSSTDIKFIPICQEQDPKGKLTPTEIAIIATAAAVVFLIFIVILICAVHKYRVLQQKRLLTFTESLRQRADDDVLFDYWELGWDKLLVKSEKLGSGAYGQVFRGKLIGKLPSYDNFYRRHATSGSLNQSMFEDCEVAIKMLPKYATDAARSEFMHEIELMKSFGYSENLVTMLGCITVGSPMCLVMEYCSNRDLLHFLKQKKLELDISQSQHDAAECTKDMLLFAWQIADGMRFLSSLDIVHRDLAARNILIDNMKNAKGVCYAESTRLPIKWLAPEALIRQEFSTKSDVWSFGIVLYEMYSFGEIPFAEVEPADLVQHILAGNRPPKPEICSDRIYGIALMCLRESPLDRPVFEELLTILTVLLEQATEGYGYLTLLRTTSEPRRAIETIQSKIQTALSRLNSRKKSRRESDVSDFSIGVLSMTISLDDPISRRETIDTTIMRHPRSLLNIAMPSWLRKDSLEAHSDFERHLDAVAAIHNVKFAPDGTRLNDDDDYESPHEYIEVGLRRMKSFHAAPMRESRQSEASGTGPKRKRSQSAPVPTERLTPRLTVTFAEDLFPQSQMME